MFLVLSVLLCGCYYSKRWQGTEVQWWVSGSMGVINIAWGALGCSLHRQLSAQCQSTDEGKYVYAYGILKILFGILEIFLVMDLPQANQSIHKPIMNNVSAQNYDSIL